MSKRTEAVSAGRAAAKASGAHLTKKARMATMGRLFGLIHDKGYQVADVRRLKEKHFALYIEWRKGAGLSVRTLQNEAAHIREAMRAVGRNQAADSPTISNKALDIHGSCRGGTKVAATDEEFLEALAIAEPIDEGLAAALKLQRWLGLRGAESVRAGPSLRTWEKNLIVGAPVTVIYGTKGGRSRQTKPADAGKALEAVREALAVAAKQGDRIIDRPTLKAAMKWYTNTMHREITEQVGIQAHALRYAYACDMLDAYVREGFSTQEADAQTSLDLGHGDGRGRYVRKVYSRRPADPHLQTAHPAIVSGLPTGGDAMSDDTKSRGEPDRSRINVNQDHELRYWTKELGVSEERLREAVKEVGTSADEVREFLSRR